MRQQKNGVETKRVNFNLKILVHSKTTILNVLSVWTMTPMWPIKSQNKKVSATLSLFKRIRRRQPRQSPEGLLTYLATSMVKKSFTHRFELICAFESCRALDFPFQLSTPLTLLFRPLSTDVNKSLQLQHIYFGPEGTDICAKTS